MICVKFKAFCDLRADLRFRLATLRKSVRKFCFCKLALTCESVWPGLNPNPNPKKGTKLRKKERKLSKTRLSPVQQHNQLCQMAIR